MFSNKQLIVCYKGDSIDENEWRGGEWFDATESDLRNEIAKTFDAIGYHSIWYLKEMELYEDRRNEKNEWMSYHFLL